MNYSNTSKLGFTPLKKEEIYRNYAYSRLVETGMSESMAFKLSKVTKTMSFDEGEVIWEKGKPAGAWCHIVKGCVGITTNSKKDTFEPLGIFAESAWFGEHHIVSNTCTHADYVCLADTELLMIPQKYVAECLEQDVGFSIYLAKLMAWRIQKTSESLLLMKSDNRCMRVVMGLYSTTEMITQGFDQPVSAIVNGRVRIPFTQNLIASICGVSRTIFSQHARKLFHAGLLNIAYGSIEIVNIKAWQRFAEFQKSRGTVKRNMSIDELLCEFQSLEAAAGSAERLKPDLRHGGLVG